MNLKYGVLINGMTLSRWEKDVIDSLNAHPQCKLSLIVLNAGVTVSGNKFSKRIHFLAYKLFSKTFQKAKALQKINCEQEFSGIETIACRPLKKGRFIEYFNEADIKLIKSKNLDFLFRFGFNILKGDLLESTRFGVWSYHHGDEMKYRGGPAGLWEIYHNDPVSGVILQKLTDELDRGEVLKKGYYKTIDYSYSKQVDQLYMKSTHFPISVINQLVKENELKMSPSLSTAPIYKVPHNRQTIILTLKIIKNFFIKELKTFFNAENWQLAYQLKDGSLAIKENESSRVFSADLFDFKYDGKQYLLYEKYDYKTAKGNIYCCRFDGRNFIDDQLVINENFHLSYPFVFDLDGEIYCLPEMSDSGNQWIYQCDGGPYKWKKWKKICENALVDPSLHHQNGIWYLFYTNPTRDPDADLNIKWSKNLEGPWKEHPQNPVIVDINGARPAGRLYIDKDILYRPAQNSSRGYGSEVVLKKITKLNTEEYEEVETGRISPPFPYKGLHSFNNNFIDLKTSQFQINQFTKSMKRFF